MHSNVRRNMHGKLKNYDEMVIEGMNPIQFFVERKSEIDSSILVLRETIKKYSLSLAEGK